MRVLKNEFLTAILSPLNVKTSHPLTSSFLPSEVVPVKSHSDTPRSPATKWRAPPKLASGKRLKTPAKASRTCSRPAKRLPQASGPAVVSKTQSSAMKPMMKSTSCRFQPSPNASRSLIVTMPCLLVEKSCLDAAEDHTGRAWRQATISRARCMGAAQSFNHLYGGVLLQVVPGVRLVEGLVAEREVGNDVLDPVEAIRGGRHDPVDDGAAPSLDETEGGLEGRQRPERRVERPSRHLLDGLADEPHGLPGFLDAHPRPGFDVTRLEDGDLDGELAVGGEGMIAPDIGVDPGGARHDAQHAVIAGRACRQPARALEPVADEGVVEGQRHDLLEVLERRIQLARQVEAFREVAADSARHDAAAEQPIARHPLVEPQQPLTDAEAVRVRDGEAGVVDDHAEVGHVVVQALELEQDHAQIARAIGHRGGGRG